MKNTPVLLFALFVSLLAKSASAIDIEYQYHGNNCVSVTPGLTGTVSQYGIYNSSTTKVLTVTCPAESPYFNYTYGYVDIKGYNRSSATALKCRLNATSNDGYSIITATATIQRNSQSSQEASALTTQLMSYPKFYMTCDIPAATAQGVSHLTAVYLSFRY